MTAALLVFAIAVFVFTAVCVIQFIRVAIDAAEEATRKEREALVAQIKTAMNNAATLDALKAAWSLTAGKKTKLGEDAYTALETIKDVRKSELLKAA